MTKGQRAMAVAKILPKQQGRKTSLVSREVDKSRLSLARIVLQFAPELADQVLSGAVSLDKAYDDAKYRQSVADRIKARAIRKLGELAEAIEPGKPGPKPSELEAGARPQLTRGEAGAAAGLSAHQLKQALRVARVPAEDFERQVQSAHTACCSADYWMDGILG